MTTNAEASAGEPGSDAFVDSVEELLVVGYEQAGGDWQRAEELLCAQHPELAESIRWRIEALRDQSWFDAVPGDTAPSFPERLGDFRLLRRLGGGGMGVVYLAEQESLRRQVALKLIRPEHLYFESSRSRFRREVEAVAQLQHEGIVPVHAVGEQDGLPYLAMARISGCTLAEALAVLRRRDPATLQGTDLRAAIGRRLDAGDSDSGSDSRVFAGSWVETALRIAAQVAEALDHAHARGVLHRDVKPSNVMLTPTGRALLFDFGLAHVEGDNRLTQTGSTIGSLPYSPPEQVTDSRAEPHAGMDVYALGVTLYELLTLRQPFEDGGEEAVRQQIVRGEPEPPRRHNRAIPWDAETVCLKAMERSPKLRYESAAALARDLRNVVELRPIEARRPGPVLRARRWVQQHPAWTAASLVGAVLLVLASVAFWLRELDAAGRIRLRQDAVATKALLADWHEILPLGDDEIAEASRWLEQADAVLGRSAERRAELAALQARALPRTEPEVEADRLRRQSALSRVAFLENLQQFRDGTKTAWMENVSGEIFHHLLDEVSAKLARARREVQQRYTWRFRDTDDLERHEALRGFVPMFAELEHVVAQIGDQLRRASESARSSLHGHRRQWLDACAAIADPLTHPLYGGLRIEPQQGLVPLGRDPDSGLFEFAHPVSGAIAQRDSETGRLQIDPDTGLVFVLIPGGFLDEQPIAPFFLSKLEMTQAQWLRLTGRNPSCYRAGSTYSGFPITGFHPVENVGWLDCSSLMQRMGLSLPTHGQWEYAFHGQQRDWCRKLFRTTPDSLGNVADESARGWPGFARHHFAQWKDGYVFHAPVGQFAANPFGLLDILGNLSEWCADEKPGSVDNWPLYRVRGSSYRSYYHFMHAPGRDPYGQAVLRNNLLGLRPARAVQ